MVTRSLIKGFEFAGVEDQILLYNRTFDNATILKSEFPQIEIVKSPSNIIKTNSLIFVVIPPTAILELPDDFIAKINCSQSILMSCANYVTIDKLSSKYKKLKIIRLLPNILWQIGSGAILYSINKKIKLEEKNIFLELISKLGDTIEIKDEADFDRFGKIMTCGPGIFSKLINILIKELELKSDNEKYLVKKCILSTINYSNKSKKSFETITEEVANKGGLTECAVNELDQQLDFY